MGKQSRMREMRSKIRKADGVTLPLVRQLAANGEAVTVYSTGKYKLRPQKKG